MKKLHLMIVMISCALGTPCCYGQEEFIFGKVTPALIKDADAIIRLEEDIFEVQSKSEARSRKRRVITILNENGESRYSQTVIGYNKLTKITDVSGAIYGADGKLLRRLKASDIEDYSASGNELTDSRIKLVEFGKKSYPYPYTLELSYETKDKNMMFYPAWDPLGGPKTSVEKSIFRITVPAGFEFRYKEYNGVPSAEKSKDKNGNDNYQWVMNNIPVVEAESFQLPDIDLNPMVLTAPSEFEIQDYAGNFTNWQDMSKFYYDLNAGRDVLPAATVEEIKNLVKDCKTEKEKVYRIYKWVQGRTRYYSIQLGIGGWQTIDATTVATKGYGDCKALTNFVLASLKQAGIESYAALIKAGDDEKINTEFPSSQFNHVIACTIADKDTIWLECTSQTSQPNYLGSFTGNRHALLVMPKNGKLVATPGYDSGSNFRRRNASIKLDENGAGQLSTKTVYGGLQHESRKRLLDNSSHDDQRKWLLNNLNLPSVELKRFEFLAGTSLQPVVTETLEMDVRNFAGKTGSRLFLKPNLMTRTVELPIQAERKTDFYLPPGTYNFTDADSLRFELPAGFVPESALPAFKIQSAFGVYEASATLSDNKLIYFRKLTMKGGRYKKAEYTAWLDFLKAVKKADRAQVVLVKK
ncbi:hypothetical protein DYBT9275_00140 [Dyadobacter sp. CECT 9275]|uniref:DUF3857 domain-containing protein n=1 Tax=Dyadobacter helix TaxID=2822344 RepID=A0A916NA75_9BACT|nr:DUF3857 domain-containing protein [Dyadobacter sp. CECT 9275]CAG4988701.1 hypothetical protein DYBT9275_00140 [Dyadobacter sp. CECT 9275]